MFISTIYMRLYNFLNFFNYFPFSLYPFIPLVTLTRFSDKNVLSILFGFS